MQTEASHELFIWEIFFPSSENGENREGPGDEAHRPGLSAADEALRDYSSHAASSHLPTSVCIVQSTGITHCQDSLVKEVFELNGIFLVK